MAVRSKLFGDDHRWKDGNPLMNEEFVFKYWGLAWGQKLKVTQCQNDA